MAQKAGLAKTGDESETRTAGELVKADDSVSKEMSDTKSDDTEQIKAEIEETRSHMGETIDAIQDRLSFSNISEQVSEQVGNAIETAKGTVYDATIGKAVNFMRNTRDGVMESSALKTVTENPLPFALIGAGAALLIYNSFGADGRRKRMSKYRTKNYLASESREDTQHGAQGVVSRAAETVSNQAGRAYDAVSSKAGSAYDTVSRTASDTYAGAARMANRAYNKVGDVGTAAQENYDYYLEEKPLAVAAVAAALGAAVGFAIPITRYEGKWMGESKQMLLDKAEETATDFVDKAKQVATDAGRAATEEIQSAAGMAAQQQTQQQRPSSQQRQS